MGAVIGSFLTIDARMGRVMKSGVLQNTGRWLQAHYQFPWACTQATPDHDPSFYLKATDKTFSLQSPTFETVYKFLSEIDEKKAVGLDNIPNKLLKMAAQVVAPSLTGIFSASIRTGIFPNEWKASRVTPIFKSGPKSNPSNYRPISIIPAVAKIFEKIISDQFMNT